VLIPFFKKNSAALKIPGMCEIRKPVETIQKQSVAGVVAIRAPHQYLRIVYKNYPGMDRKCNYLFVVAG